MTNPVNKADIELYFPHVEVYENLLGFVWGIPNYLAGSHAAEWVKEPAAPSGTHHATKELALAAAAAYCWSQPWIVNAARAEAIEAARFQAAMKKSC